MLANLSPFSLNHGKIFETPERQQSYGQQDKGFDLICLNLMKIFLPQTKTYLILFGMSLYLDSD